MRILSALDARLQAQRGHLFPWAPVFFGFGIYLYFLSASEPGLAQYIGAGVVACACLVFARRGDGSGLLATALVCAALGFLHMGLRAHLVQEPVLSFRYYGPVEGQVVEVDRSASDAPRITLQHLRLDRVSPLKTPKRVRLSLIAGAAPDPGAWVMTTAHLSPPQGPVEPGGFDYRRHAWFLRLGAVGYTRVPVLAMQEPDVLPIATLRAKVSAAVLSRMPRASGGVATALITGDRAYVPQRVIEALRASNLAHLLAISGLHMGLFAGLAFASLRRVLILVPHVGLRWPVKKIAAFVALCLGFGYLLLSGANVATERAFVMVAVMLGAVLLDRRAISLRAVAIAALLVLLRRPETLLSPGFQMSFAATTALVVAFKTLQSQPQVARWGSHRLLRWGTALVISSLVAGLATAPFGAAHFNMVSHYGLLANLAAVPVMGAVVAPGALLALLLAPFGASWLGLWIMGRGIEWIIWVAETVAALPGARRAVVTPSAWILPMIVCGGLLLLLWQGRMRWLGALPIGFALALWPQSDRPVVLISGDAGLVGIMTPHGRAVSRSSGKGFVAENWLENDGDLATQAEAALRWGADTEPKVRRFQTLSYELVHVQGKTGVAQFGEVCSDQQIVVVSVETDRISGPCRLITSKTLRDSGALALTATGEGIPTNAPERRRIWSPN